MLFGLHGRQKYVSIYIEPPADNICEVKKMKMIKKFIAMNGVCCCISSMLAGFAAGFIAGKLMFDKQSPAEKLKCRLKKAFKAAEDKIMT